MEKGFMNLNNCIKTIYKKYEFVINWRKNGGTMIQYIGYSQTSREVMIQLGGKCYILNFP
jgi:hypothetical protein